MKREKTHAILKTVVEANGKALFSLSWDSDVKGTRSYGAEWFTSVEDCYAYARRQGFRVTHVPMAVNLSKLLRD